MSEVDRFCGVCGKKLTIGDITGYDTKTGDALHAKCCPSGSCGHYGISHSRVEISAGKAFGSDGTFRCTRCGDVSEVFV